jgi:hypothetical protein
MRNLILVLLALVAVAPAGASQPGGHKADVGVLAVVQDSDRGGGKVEGRWNLTPTDPDAAVYACLGAGLSSWYYTHKPKGVGKAIDVVLVAPWVYNELSGNYKRKAGNYTEWKTNQTFLDVGLGAGLHTWTFGAGLTFVSYNTDVIKLINGDEYTGSGKGSAWGGYGQVGISFPIGNMFLDFIAGYRETRGTARITTTNARGATNIAPIRPILGPYGNIGLRYRFN